MKFRLLHAPIVWSFYSGAQLSAALGGNVYVEESNTTTRIMNDEIQDIDAGLTIGTEVGLPLGRSRIFLDLRYALGIIPALKREKARNQVISLYLGYGFTL